MNIGSIKKIVKTINQFRNLYYSLKFKKQFRKFLWEKIREPKIQKYYSPNNLIELLRENENENVDVDEELDEVLNNW